MDSITGPSARKIASNIERQSDLASPLNICWDDSQLGLEASPLNICWDDSQLGLESEVPETQFPPSPSDLQFEADMRMIVLDSEDPLNTCNVIRAEKWYLSDEMVPDSEDESEGDRSGAREVEARCKNGLNPLLSGGLSPNAPLEMLRILLPLLVFIPSARLLTDDLLHNGTLSISARSIWTRFVLGIVFFVAVLIGSPSSICFFASDHSRLIVLLELSNLMTTSLILPLAGTPFWLPWRRK